MLPPTNRRQYRDLEQLLDDEEELATLGLARGSRRLGREALDTLGISRRGRGHSLATAVLAAGAMALLVRRRRAGRSVRRRSRLFSKVLGFAASSLLGTVVNVMLGSKRDGSL